MCGKPVRKVTCENSTFVKTIIKHRMVTRYGQRVCNSIVRRSNRTIRCRPKRITRSKCRKCVRTIRIEEWSLFNCKCVRYRRTRTEACGECLHFKDHDFRFCSDSKTNSFYRLPQKELGEKLLQSRSQIRRDVGLDNQTWIQELPSHTHRSRLTNS